MTEAISPFVHAEYTGTGKLLLDKSFPCKFSVTQHNSGSILVSLRLTERILRVGADFELPGPCRLEGTTDEGHRVLTSDSLSLLNYDPSNERLEFWARWVDVQVDEQAPDEVRFDVVNLTQRKRVHLDYASKDRSVRFVFEPHADIAERISRLGSHKQQEVLGQLVVNLSAINADTAYSTSDRMCQLMSIGVGTWVNFIATHRFFGGKVVGRRHEERITAPFGAWRPIDVRDPLALPRFVNETARSFQQVYEPFQFAKGVVHTFVNSRLETGPLQIRGVNVVGHLELLMDRFVSQHPEVSTVIDFNEWIELEKVLSKKLDKIRRTSRESLFEMLTKNGMDTGDAKKAASDLARGIKLEFFNRTSFKGKLRAFRAKYQVPLSDDELGELVHHRNHLIHTGGFAPPPSEEKHPEEPDGRWQLKAYVFLLSVVDRTILSLLNYAGHYSDWRTYPPQSKYFPNDIREELDEATPGQS
jgi:hypothetical protein